MTDRYGGRPPSEADIAEISRTHLIRTPLKPADLLFVFGTREDAALRADVACRLWRDGFFRDAIVSGGVTPGATVRNARSSRPRWWTRGIPSDRILEEHRAMNTGENVIFSLPVIEAALGRSNIRSVICLGNSWTARRYPMTLHRHWPEVEKMLVTVDSFDTPLALWHTHPEFRRRVHVRMGQDRALQGERLHCGVAGAGAVRRPSLFGRIRNPLPSHSTGPASVRSGRLELLDRGRGQRQPDGVRRMPGADREGRRRRQRDVPPGGGGDEGLRAPVRRQRQPQMIGFAVGLDLEAGKVFGGDLLALLRVDPLQPRSVRRRCRRPSAVVRRRTQIPRRSIRPSAPRP